MNDLTLKQMATRLKKKPKSFARLVRDVNIPYQPTTKNPNSLRGALFDPVAVEAHLRSLLPKDNILQFKGTVRKSPQTKSRFAEEVGI